MFCLYFTLWPSDYRFIFSYPNTRQEKISKMAIFKQDSLLAKLNQHYSKAQLKIYSHFETVKRLWQSNSFKPASVNLSFNNMGQFCYQVNSPNIKTAPMSHLPLTGLFIQPHSQLTLIHQKSTISIASNFLSFLDMPNREVV